MQYYDKVEKMNKAFVNFDYTTAYKYLKKYLDDKNNGVYDYLIGIAIDCEIAFGRFDEALKNIEIINRVWPDFYDSKQLSDRYIRCFRPDLSEEIMNNNNLTVKEYYFLAQNYMIHGYTELAEKWLNYYVDNYDDSSLRKKAIDFLYMIEDYKDGIGFLPTTYSYLEKDGKSLEPGHVFYVNSINDKNCENKTRIPYMIWKIVSNDIYAFPVHELKERSDYDYCIGKNKYPHIGFDRVISEPMIHIKKYNVEKVIDKIDEFDYTRALKQIYDRTCRYKNEKYDYFFKIMNQELNINNGEVLFMYDNENKKENYYYILNVDEENNNIECLRLIKDNLDYKIVGDEIINIRRNDYITKTFLSSSQKENILNQINNDEKVKRLVK